MPVPANMMPNIIPTTIPPMAPADRPFSFVLGSGSALVVDADSVSDVVEAIEPEADVRGRSTPVTVDTSRSGNFCPS
jgi:hypothetical protein